MIVQTTDSQNNREQFNEGKVLN